MNEPTLFRPGRGGEEAPLKRLAKLYERLARQREQLNETERQIAAATRELALARGCAFIRPEHVKSEIEALIRAREEQA